MRKEIVTLFAVLLPMACHQLPAPRETRSVYLPLAVGNRWVYDVTSTGEDDSAVIEIVSRETDGYRLSISCDARFVRLIIPFKTCLLRCCDSVLESQKWGRDWDSILSDDPGQTCATFLLLSGYPVTESYSGMKVVVEGDTYRDCQRLKSYLEWTVYPWGGGDPYVRWSRDQETYAPEVGLVAVCHEESGYSRDVLQLRHYSLADQ